MLDQFLFPKSDGGIVDRQVFVGPGVSTQRDVYVWTKPAGASFVCIYLLSSGGGGGGGCSGASGTQRGGGGGGASGGYGLLLLHSDLCPSNLAISLAGGGLGGNADVAGGAGAISYVLVEPQAGVPTDANILLRSNGATAPGGGGAGTAAAAGAGGTIGGGVATNTLIGLQMGSWQLLGGLAGTAGSANGAATSASSMIIPMPGIGGGGVSSADVAGTGGGQQTSAGNWWIVEPAAVGDARHGTFFGPPSFPLLFMGGYGGGGSALGVGGRGGDGILPGTGGGGGGGGVTGGRGGDGGPGLCIITCW